MKPFGIWIGQQKASQLLPFGRPLSDDVSFIVTFWFFVCVTRHKMELNWTIEDRLGITSINTPNNSKTRLRRKCDEAESLLLSQRREQKSKEASGEEG
jgi:hypothetical protein